MRCFRIIAGAAIVCLAAVNFGLGAESVGEVVKVKQEVTGSGVSGSRDLAVSDAVFRSEEISAADQSHGELRLSDDSKIIVGENSTIVLDEFVVGESGFAAGTVNVVKGAFRFVTGNSRKGALKVRTPLSTIGIRGTLFDVYVHEGIENVVLFRGEVQVCTRTGMCRTANRSCDVIEIKSENEIEKAPFFRSAKARNRQRDFDLTEKQKKRFTKGWRAPLRSCSARAAMEALEGETSPGSEPEIAEPEPRSHSYGCNAANC